MPVEDHNSSVIRRDRIADECVHRIIYGIQHRFCPTDLAPYIEAQVTSIFPYNIDRKNCPV